MYSLFLLQGILLTQESNQDLLHCRWILYQLSYRGSPKIHMRTQHSDLPVAQLVKTLPADAGDAREGVRSLSVEDPLEKEMEVHSSVLV